MAINLQSTNSVVNDGIKMLVYGAAGTGKTFLIPTLPSPVILSAEGGLLSISDHNIPFVEIKSMETLEEAYAWLTESEEGGGHPVIPRSASSCVHDREAGEISR